MKKGREYFLLILLFFISTKNYADSFCGVVLAENGLNVRSAPNLDSNVIYTLGKGSTFKLHPGSYTGIYQTIKDGNENLEGQWVEIDMYDEYEKVYHFYEGDFETKTAFIFMTPKYAKEIFDCREFRFRIEKEDLYVNYSSQEYLKKSIDSIQSLVSLEIFESTIDGSANTPSLIKNKKHYKVNGDTLVLKLDNGKGINIISYPFGKNEMDESREEYKYMGLIERLNFYLIEASYYEYGDYLLVSKKNGETLATLCDIPFMSPKNAFLVSITNDIYEDLTFLQIFQLKGEQVIPYFSYTFSKWYYDNELKWVSSNEFLIAARADRDRTVWRDEYYDNSKKAQELWEKVRKRYIRVRIVSKG